MKPSIFSKKTGLGKLVFLMLSVTAFSGCMHSEEHVTINADGSGVVEAHFNFYPGTVQLVNASMDHTAQGSLNAAPAPDSAQAVTPPPATAPAAEQMFGNKKEIVEKIKNSGVPATLESYKREKMDDGIHVYYTIKTSDISALARSEVMVSKLVIMRNGSGDWFCRIVADTKAQQKSKEWQEKIEAFKASPPFQQLPSAMKVAVSRSMTDLRVESQVTFPDPLTDALSLFQKKDDRTAVIAVIAEMISNPLIVEKWGKLKKASLARTGKGAFPAEFFSPLPGEVDEAEKKDAAPVTAPATVSPTVPATIPAEKAGSQVKIFLKDGKVIEGKLLERAEAYVKIDFQGVTLTYYNDEFDRVE
jgi:hypothetical protein